MTTAYLLKLGRAGHHLNDLRFQTKAWLTGERYSIIHEPDPDGTYERRVRIILKEALPSGPFSLIIGDALYSLRSCLDNLAFDLSGGRINPQKLKNESQFPIYGNEGKDGLPVNGKVHYTSPMNKSIRNMPQAAQTAIEGLQPYNRGNDYRLDLLWMLNSLCNIDKHRSIHLVAGAFGGMMIRYDGSENFTGFDNYWSYGGPVKAETVVARYTPHASNRHREVKVDIEPMLDVGFADGPAANQSANILLMSMITHIASEVITPLEPLIPV